MWRKQHQFCKVMISGSYSIHWTNGAPEKSPKELWSERALHHEWQIFLNVGAGLIEITQTSLEWLSKKIWNSSFVLFHSVFRAEPCSIHYLPRTVWTQASCAIRGAMEASHPPGLVRVTQDPWHLPVSGAGKGDQTGCPEAPQVALVAPVGLLCFLCTLISESGSSPLLSWWAFT